MGLAVYVFDDDPANTTGATVEWIGANDLLERIRNLRNGTTQRSTPPPPDDEEMEDSPLEMPLDPSNTVDTARSPVNYGRLVKPVAFDQFYQTHSSEERQALLFVHVLQLLELAKKSDKADLWVITPDLGKNVSSWVKAFVFGPSTISYRGLNVKSDARTHVADPHEEDDIVAVDLLLASIRSQGTSQRNIYKTNVRVRF
ncbi:hypothetical protein DFH07DRAFT_967057 [Mycena maculata]|uniref:Uncharacterized protein n=1 Tax=Mycena maculata TaxID=230809 RepID=A0AAD7I7A3_9AGAR|nr:hypothetical protein DFH07DRAFT_967057 [Mycena maculata]